MEKQVVSPTSGFANIEVDSPTHVKQIRLHIRCYVLCVSRLGLGFDSFRHFPRKNTSASNFQMTENGL